MSKYGRDSNGMGKIASRARTEGKGGCELVSEVRAFIPFGMINIPARVLHGIMAAA